MINWFKFSISVHANTEQPNQYRHNVKNLGGMIELGQLYDGSTDHRIPGEFLWYRQNMTTIPGVDAEQVSDDIVEDYTLLDRINVFDLDASLKCSFMGGLVSIEGSAAYLRDQRLYEESIRVSRFYKLQGREEMVDTQASLVDHNAYEIYFFHKILNNL